jgi:hypothetical protein
MRTMFRMGFTREVFFSSVGPTLFSKEDLVGKKPAEILKQLPAPPGMTVSFPYVVKIPGEGEYLVNADGTATFLSYTGGPWGATGQI